MSSLILALTFLFVSQASAAHLDFLGERVHRLAHHSAPTYQSGTYSLLGALHAIEGYTEQSFIHEVVLEQFYEKAVAVPYVFTRDMERRFRYSLAEQGLPVNLTPDELLLLRFDPANPLFTKLRKIDFELPNKRIYDLLEADNLFFVIDVIKRQQSLNKPSARWEISGEILRRIENRVSRYLEDHKRVLIDLDRLTGLSQEAQQALANSGLKGAVPEEAIKNALSLRVAAEIWRHHEEVQSSQQCVEILNVSDVLRVGDD